MLKLKSALFEQILPDGGHEERSASYHITLLKRLIETALMIENTRNIRPIWLIDNISRSFFRMQGPVMEEYTLIMSLV